MANKSLNRRLMVDTDLAMATAQTTISSEAGDETALDLGVQEAYPQLYMEVTVTASDDGDADETYEVVFENSDTNVFTALQVVGSLLITRGDTGIYHVAVQPENQYIRAYMTVGGTTPSITWSAYAGIVRG